MHEHTNTSSTSGGSTDESILSRSGRARWLTTRSKKGIMKGIRRSNKNRLTLSKTPIYGWWRPAWILSFEGRASGKGNVARRAGRDKRDSPSRVGAVACRVRSWGVMTVRVLATKDKCSCSCGTVTLRLWPRALFLADDR